MEEAGKEAKKKYKWDKLDQSTLNSCCRYYNETLLLYY
jgi:hypothetical protein